MSIDYKASWAFDNFILERHLEKMKNLTSAEDYEKYLEYVEERKNMTPEEYEKYIKENSVLIEIDEVTEED